MSIEWLSEHAPWRLFDEFVMWLHSFGQMSSEQWFLTFFGGLLAANLVNIASAAGRRHVQRRKATMTSERGALVARVARMTVAAPAISLVLTAGAFASSVWAPDEARWVRDLGAALCAALMLVVLGHVAIRGGLRRGGIRIGSDGVTIFNHRQTRMLTWHEVLADHEALYRAGVRGIGTSMPRATRGAVINLKHLDASAEKVVETIVFFRDHPDERASLASLAAPTEIPVLRIS
jgi:hypothetical protein